MSTSNMENSKKEKYNEKPKIPVRSNRRTNFVRMSQMNGDKLPELRDVEKPEFSNRTRHFNGLVKTHMWKDVHLMHKEHVITMNKVKRSQDQVFKLLCKVTREKRIVQRQGYARRREEARAKFSSQRMLILVRKVVQKFKENVKRKQTLRKEEEKRNSVVQNSTSKQDTLTVVSDSGKGTSTSAKSTTVAETQNVEPDTKIRDVATSKGNEYGNKNTTKDTDKHQTRSHSAEGNKKKKPLYTVQTAENRTRFGTSVLDTGSTQANDTEDKSEDILMGRLPTVAVEVSKDNDHHVRLKRAGSDQDEFFKLCNKKCSAVTLDSASSNPESTTNSRQVSFNIVNENSSTSSDTDESSPPPPVYSKTNRNRRKSLFEPIDPEDDEDRDFGWFTFGNPKKKEKKAKHVDTDSLAYSDASSKSRGSQVSRKMAEKQKSVMFEDEIGCSQDTEVHDTKKENDVPYSLPPLRTRKVATIGGPSLDRLLENNFDISKASVSDSSDVKLQTKTSKDKPIHDGHDETKLSHLETAKLDARVVKRKVNFETTDSSNIINTNGDDFAIWYPVSSKERKTYFVEPLKNSKKSSFQVTESSSAVDKTVEQQTPKPAVKQKDTHKNVKEHESKFLEDEMSANYSWVLKQEERYKKSRQARILDKEEVRRYKFVSHNKLVSELVNKDATKFIPPSHKELYLQKKLERKNQDDILKQRLKIAHFHRTITVGFELDNTPQRPSDAHSSNSQSVPSVTPKVQETSKIPNLVDIFKDEGLRLSDKENSMARIRYIRNDTKFISPRKHGERRTSMWNLQDPSKLKIFKGYA